MTTAPIGYLSYPSPSMPGDVRFVSASGMIAQVEKPGALAGNLLSTGAYTSLSFSSLSDRKQSWRLLP